MKFHHASVLAFVAVGLFACSSTCLGQATTVEKAATEPGLAVGKKAPDFILNDQLGNKQQLSKLLSKGPVAIVFHRSADW